VLALEARESMPRHRRIETRPSAVFSQGLANDWQKSVGIAAGSKPRWECGIPETDNQLPAVSAFSPGRSIRARRVIARDTTHAKLFEKQRFIGDGSNKSRAICNLLKPAVLGDSDGENRSSHTSLLASGPSSNKGRHKGAGLGRRDVPCAQRWLCTREPSLWARLVVMGNACEFKELHPVDDARYSTLLCGRFHFRISRAFGWRGDLIECKNSTSRNFCRCRRLHRARPD